MSLIALDPIFGELAAQPWDIGDARALPIDVQVIANASEVERIAADWQLLESATQAPTLFQSPAWGRIVLNLEANRAPAGFAPIVLVARQAGRVVGLLPLKRVRTRVARLLTGLGEPFQQYTDLVLANGADPGRILTAMLESGDLSQHADAVELLKVREDSCLYRALAARTIGLVPVGAAPFVDLRPFGDFDSYHKTINAKSRKNMRNQRNRLIRDAPLTAHTYTTATDIAALIRSSFAGRAEWLEREGLSSRAFRDPEFGRFIAQFADGSQTGIEVLAVSLRHGGRPIAEQWGFVHKRRYYAYVASWDPAYEEASPGKLIMEEVLRAAYARGVEVADFLMPAARYKFTWAAAATPIYDIVLPLTARGRLTSKIWTGSLRPLAKRLVLAMPTAWRTRLTRRALRQP